MESNKNQIVLDDGWNIEGQSSQGRGILTSIGNEGIAHQSNSAPDNITITTKEPGMRKLSPGLSTLFKLLLLDDDFRENF